MRRMIYFPNDKIFLPSFDNAFSTEFSLDLHCAILFVDNEENIKFYSYFAGKVSI